MFGVWAGRWKTPLEGMTALTRSGVVLTATQEGNYKGTEAIGAKVLEEAEELVEAARDKGPGEVVHEAADLIYHAWVLLAEAGVTPEDVRKELAKREGIGGLEEKRSRPESKIQSPKSKMESED